MAINNPAFIRKLAIKLVNGKSVILDCYWGNCTEHV